MTHEDAVKKVEEIISSYIEPMYKEAGILLHQDLSESCSVQIYNMTKAIAESGVLPGRQSRVFDQEERRERTVGG